MSERDTRLRSMLLGSLYGDAFALGPHWIYDPARIQNEFGVITTLTQPPPGSYHKNRNKGDFTHYGDQTLLLLKLMRKSGGFDLPAIQAGWAEHMRSYDGYRDGATNRTLANIDDGIRGVVGSDSTDLSGASRIAPILYLAREQNVLDAVLEQTRMTHNNEDVIQAALFFARVTTRILAGEAVASAITAEQEALPESKVRALVDKGMAAQTQDSVPALQGFGTSCNVAHSLPGTVQILLSHAGDFTGALSANVMAGGDSAARGLLIGMVLGAALNPDDDLFREMNAYSSIIALL